MNSHFKFLFPITSIVIILSGQIGFSFQSFQANSTIHDAPTSRDIYEQNDSFQNSTFVWPNGQIPYVIHSNVTPDQHCLIHSAMYHITQCSCVRFREKSRSNSSRYLQIQINPTECASLNQLISSTTFDSSTSKSVISLSPECLTKENLVYLLMHILGLYEVNSVNEDYLPPHVQFSFDAQSLKEKAFSTKYTTNLEIEQLNKLYSCPNPVKLQISYIKQIIKYYNKCVKGKEIDKRQNQKSKSRILQFGKRILDSIAKIVTRTGKRFVQLQSVGAWWSRAMVRQMQMF